MYERGIQFFVKKADDIYEIRLVEKLGRRKTMKSQNSRDVGTSLTLVH